MADIDFMKAYIVVQDSAQKKARVELRISAADAQAYVAAANTAARAATKVGLLLESIEELILDTPDCIYAWGVDYGFLLDTFSPPVPEDKFYRSNKLKVDYNTTNAGLPATGSFTIPMRDESDINMESNGINVTKSGAGATAQILDLVAQVLDTVVSSYGTAVTAVSEITVNDA